MTYSLLKGQNLYKLTLETKLSRFVCAATVPCSEHSGHNETSRALHVEAAVLRAEAAEFVCTWRAVYVGKQAFCP